MVKINFYNKYPENLDLDALAKKIVNQTCEHLNIKTNYEISFIYVDDLEINELNKQYRNMDKPTDVLTFEGEDDYLGDVFISIDTVKRQAVEFDNTFEEEMSFMFVHGLLHALGYDHIEDDESSEMFAIQDKVLEAINE